MEANVGWDGVPGDLQRGANRVSLVYGVSDIGLCWLCGPVHLSVWEKALMPDTSVPPCSTGAFQAATLVLDLRRSESE